MGARKLAVHEAKTQTQKKASSLRLSDRSNEWVHPGPMFLSRVASSSARARSTFPAAASRGAGRVAELQAFRENLNYVD